MLFPTRLLLLLPPTLPLLVLTVPDYPNGARGASAPVP